MALIPQGREHKVFLWIAPRMMGAGLSSNDCLLFKFLMYISLGKRLKNMGEDVQHIGLEVDSLEKAIKWFEANG